MRKSIAIISAVFLAATTSPTLASSDDPVCRVVSGQQMSIQEITAKASSLGYEVRAVERDDGCYEVEATDVNGLNVEFHMHPVTGEIINSKNKS